MKNIFTALNTGVVAKHDADIPACDREWNSHPVFEGVALKHLVVGADTDGRFSAHLVRLEPGAGIGDHVHESNWELHEIASGSGHCVLDGKRIAYEAGVAAVMPEGMNHSVQAGDDGLNILAKFVPALL
ncbi:cupin domain-containing protein [uncultured Pseudodesulfovibrio sp.]|uniref:cupin domain-containing protein n=1 Tax=uncultured Pseudodesulfovibrio sp. TaxID=2035858 RepID=UPI0029C67554|nr:cupin domain-containing protein [uncultured Pseudodesulfovibrio sp.]